MRALFLLSVVILAVIAGKHHKNSASGDSSSSSSDIDYPAQDPSVCALYPVMPVEEDLDSDEKPKKSTSDSSSYFYDPVQFLPNGGFYAGDVSAPSYHFSFCSANPNPNAVEFCNSEDVAVCAVVNGVGISLGSFASQKFEINAESYEEGFNLTYSLPKEASACANGIVATFVLNCSRHYDPETNYTVSSFLMAEDGCGVTFFVNTPAACPIYIEQNYSHRLPFNAAHNILMIAGIISLVVLVCSCCVLCCVCRKVARERCARNRAACASKKSAPAPAPIAKAPAVAPRQPQPPVTPPPQQFQPQQQQQQFPGYFVPAPQGMNPMYPNLYQGGYMPLVPMMQPVQMPAQNPFAQVTSAHVDQRSQQEAEDERLARALQAQFNQEQA